VWGVSASESAEGDRFTKNVAGEVNKILQPARHAVDPVRQQT
jgi:hypothetical protein